MVSLPWCPSPGPGWCPTVGLCSLRLERQSVSHHLDLHRYTALVLGSFSLSRTKRGPDNWRLEANKTLEIGLKFCIKIWFSRVGWETAWWLLPSLPEYSHKVRQYECYNLLSNITTLYLDMKRLGDIQVLFRPRRITSNLWDESTVERLVYWANI